ncbi:MAG TPA: antiactivator of flagellar biosynthesis FleN protein [Herbaspirillum sp.]|nr:antiactivator of flagellar biosynthesis FleN protein [Herbaspirillum sp.]
MVSYAVDQAEGLRRMLERPKPRLFTFLSVLPAVEKQSMLFNLGASLREVASHVLLLDTSSGANDFYNKLLRPRMATLLDVAREERTLDDVIQALPQGIGLALLSRQDQPEALRQHAARIAAVFDSLATQADIVMFNGVLNADDTFPIAAMESGEIVIQVSTSSISIKSAYILLKRLSDKLGRRRFSLLLTGGSEKEAQMVYDNLAQAASRYMAIDLDLLGAVPADEHLARAAGQGRTVIDAFPRASASLAFKRIAGHFLAPAGAYGIPPVGIQLGV